MHLETGTNASISARAKVEHLAVVAKETLRSKQSEEIRTKEEGESGREMGFMFRVRLASFFAGAAAASVAGFYLLYKDYMFAQEAISHQVKGLNGTLDERYEALNGRISALENLKKVEVAASAEASE